MIVKGLNDSVWSHHSDIEDDEDVAIGCRIANANANILNVHTNHQRALKQTENGLWTVVRSGSVNGNLVNKSRYQERLQNANNSWRRSNGWKRVVSPSPSPSPTVNSPKKESSKSIELKSPPKTTPTRIPSCIPTSIAPNNQQQKLNTTSNTAAHLQQQQQQAPRKSKIPPPVPVRRSYAS
ncbi:hypothetical protein DOY81_012971 [Sarcophaga bullata]|nr:hypothetical protein DOY81_012971 [Sarcophaga bullata]